MKTGRITLKAFTVMMAFCLLLSFSFFAFPETASAIDHDTILSPTNNGIYIIGNKITVKACPLLLSAQGKSYMQVEILKSGKRVYFENKRFTSLDNITMPSFKPAKTGKYTIKAGIVITDDDPPDYIYHEQDKVTFTVKRLHPLRI